MNKRSQPWEDQNIPDEKIEGQEAKEEIKPDKL